MGQFMQDSGVMTKFLDEASKLAVKVSSVAVFDK